jgi:hypothetical protein
VTAAGREAEVETMGAGPVEVPCAVACAVVRVVLERTGAEVCELLVVLTRFAVVPARLRVVVAVFLPVVCTVVGPPTGLLVEMLVADEGPGRRVVLDAAEDVGAEETVVEERAEVEVALTAVTGSWAEP